MSERGREKGRALGRALGHGDADEAHGGHTEDTRRTHGGHTACARRSRSWNLDRRDGHGDTNDGTRRDDFRQSNRPRDAKLCTSIVDSKQVCV